MLTEEQKASLPKGFEKWLRAAYMYYWGTGDQESNMPDAEWDRYGRILKQHWNDFEHPDKHLVEYEFMNSLHYIPRDSYPDYCKQ